MRVSTKIDKRKLFKGFAIFFAVVFSVLFLAFAAFYNDSGRKFIIDHVVSYLQNENFSLKIEGANEKLTYVDKITAKFSGNLLEIYNANFERDGIFSRPRIQVKKVVFQADDKEVGKTADKKDNDSVKKTVDKKNDGSVKKNVDKKGNVAVVNSNSQSSRSDGLNSHGLNSDGKGSDSKKTNNLGDNFKTILSYAKKVKVFIESLKIAETDIFVGDFKRKYENFAYKSENGRDFVSMKSTSIKTNPPQFNFVLDWSNSGSLTGDFQNIEGFSGNIFMNSLERSEPKYKVEVGNSEYKINADGSFADKMNTLIISKGVIQCYGKKLDFHGKVWLNKNRANLVTILSLSNFTDISKIPTEITKNFQNILTDITIEKKGNGVNSQIEFKRDNRKLGNCNIVLQGKNLSVKSDVSWIKFWGHGVKTLDVCSKDLKNFVINILGTDILGKDIKINSEVFYEKDLIVRKFVCEFQKGQISLIRPFSLNKSNLDTALKFDLQSLNSLQKYFKVKGVVGDLFMNNGLLDVKAKVDSIVGEKLEVYKGKVSGNLKDLNINVGSAKILDNILKSVNLKKKVTK